MSLSLRTPATSIALSVDRQHTGFLVITSFTFMTTSSALVERAFTEVARAAADTQGPLRVVSRANGMVRRPEWVPTCPATSVPKIPLPAPLQPIESQGPANRWRGVPKGNVCGRTSGRRRVRSFIFGPAYGILPTLNDIVRPIYTNRDLNEGDIWSHAGTRDQRKPEKNGDLLAVGCNHRPEVLELVSQAPNECRSART